MFKMNTMLLILVVAGFLKFIQGDTILRCIECEHTSWNQTYTFSGVQNLYQLLQNKYNPACAQDNPLDQNLYQQTLKNQTGQKRQQPGIPLNTFYLNRYDIRDTKCPAYDKRNVCNYIRGKAVVYFSNYGESMRLEMHIRNCIVPNTYVEVGCYTRDTSNSEVTNLLEDRLNFLGSVKVTYFDGMQCYCRSDMCYQFSSDRQVLGTACSTANASTTCTVTNSECKNSECKCTMGFREVNATCILDSTLNSAITSVLSAGMIAVNVLATKFLQLFATWI